MNEEDIELLLTLEKTRNITKTAEQMNLTQPALTRRIQILEQELGTRLLLRSRNGAVFTPVGEAILPRVRQIRKGFDEIRGYTNLHAGKICGKIKCGVSINYAQFCMADTIAAYSSRYPDVSLHIESSQSMNIYKRLLSRDFSLAVLRGKYKWDGICINFQKEPVYLIASAACEIADLRHMDYIHRSMEADLSRSVADWLAENDIPAHYHIHVDNIRSAIGLVEKNLGWAIVPGACLADFRGFRMPLTYQNGRALTRDTYLLCTEEYYHFPQVQLFCQEILRHGNVSEAMDRLPQGQTVPASV